LEIWSEQIEILFKSLGQIQGAKLPPWLSLNQALFNIHICRRTFSQSLRLIPIKTLSPPQNKDDNRPQASKHYWSGSSSEKLPYPQSKFYKKCPAQNHGKKSKLA